MSLYGKFSLGLVFLLVASVAQVQAQSVPDGSGSCKNIEVMVTDQSGSPIMGATVVTEDSTMELRTDSQGIADVPCRSFERALPMVKISAPGYRTASTALLPPDTRSMVAVRLDRNDPVSHSAGMTVNASELKLGVRKDSVNLQREAERALAAKDYQNAEKLFLKALLLTPSEATISNNLGVIALSRKDFESAGSWFQKAAEEAPYKADILGNLGLIRWMQHRDDESYVALAKAFVYGYDTDLGNYILGTIGLARGNSEEAAEHLKKVPTDRFPYRDLYLSIALRNCGKEKSADQTYRAFLKRNPAPFLISSLR